MARVSTMGVAEALALLGVSPGASEVQLRRAFRRRVLVIHPDRRGGDAAAGVALRLLVAAYAVALADARGERPEERPLTPERPRERFVCVRCDDSFEHEDACPRCALPLHDTLRAPLPPLTEDARVAGFVAALDARGEPGPPMLETHVANVGTWALLAGGALSLFAYLPVAVMFLGYGAFMLALRAQENLRR